MIEPNYYINTPFFNINKINQLQSLNLKFY